MNETLLTVVGNVVDAPSRRALESGVSVTTFRVASTNRRFDKGEQRWTDGDPLYLRVTCWRQLADNTARSLSKGDPVMVTGRLFTRLYEVDGQRRASYELEASAVGLDLNRGTADFHRVSSRPGATVAELDDEGLPAAPDAAAGAGGAMAGTDGIAADLGGVSIGSDVGSLGEGEPPSETAADAAAVSGFAGSGAADRAAADAVAPDVTADGEADGAAASVRSTRSKRRHPAGV